MIYKPIIGLEVHVELATKSKMFCGCPADHFGKKPNTQTCPVCLGLPGALPVPNKKAVEWTVMLGLALGCEIPKESKFDRKNYFYPDLPKGYQISQYDQPLCINGHIELNTGNEAIKSYQIVEPDTGNQYVKRDQRFKSEKKLIRIRRVHLEEDTGKLQHQDDMTLVDFNRSGVPLVEIVTEPDFRSIEQVDIFLKKLQQIIRYLGISNADMEKGSMRLEPSISLSSDGELPNYRVELKNINSFRFARKALEYEIKRQQTEPHVMQTRGWNEQKNATIAQREKEQAHDYRYFPEPDIPPMHITFNPQLPELPDAKIARFKKEYGLDDNSAVQICDAREQADYFEVSAKLAIADAKKIANFIINKKTKLSPKDLIAFIHTSRESVSEEFINQIISANPNAVSDYKKGKTAALMFLVGQAKRQNPNLDTDSLIEKLKNLL